MGHRRRWQPHLTLAELEALAGALLTVLLAFLLARIAGHEAFSLQLATQLRVELLQGTGNAHANCTGLGHYAAAIASGDYVEARAVLREHECLTWP